MLCEIVKRTLEHNLNTRSVSVVRCAMGSKRPPIAAQHTPQKQVCITQQSHNNAHREHKTAGQFRREVQEILEAYSIPVDGRSLGPSAGSAVTGLSAAHFN